MDGEEESVAEQAEPLSKMLLTSLPQYMYNSELPLGCVKPASWPLAWISRNLWDPIDIRSVSPQSVFLPFPKSFSDGGKKASWLRLAVAVHDVGVRPRPTFE